MSYVKLSEIVLEGFKSLDVASISDAMDKLGIFGAFNNIKAVGNNRIFGQAYTVHYVPCGQKKGTVGDFLDEVQPGQVVVIDNNGRTDCTVWGDIMSFYANQKSIAGTLIDGVCRDVDLIRKLDYPVYSKGSYMVTGKDRVYVDHVNIPVSISGVQVLPGDLIIGDSSGVLSVPIKYAKEILDLAIMIEEKEQEIIFRIKNGKSLEESRRELGYHSLQTPDSDK